MLTVDPDQRVTADQALDHVWISRPDIVAPTEHLSETVHCMKMFNARRKFKVRFSLNILFDYESQ